VKSPESRKQDTEYRKQNSGVRSQEKVKRIKDNRMPDTGARMSDE
jgi:hypothetical protein